MSTNLTSEMAIQESEYQYISAHQDTLVTDLKVATVRRRELQRFEEEIIESECIRE